MNKIRIICAAALFSVINLSGNTWAAQAHNPEVTGVTLEVENNLTNCMEERDLTFTAKTAVTWRAGGPINIVYILYIKGPTGSFEERDKDWTLSQTCVFDEYTAPKVPRTGGAKSYSLQAYATAQDEKKTYSLMTSSTLNIDVRRLWIDKFRDDTTDKPWKVVVGRDIEYEAFASDDCVSWDWDMEDGVADAWNPIDGNARSGTKMKIPYSDLSRAASGFRDNWFGDKYGAVNVACKDGEGNSYKIYSTDQTPSKKAEVFFDPDLNVDGASPTDAKPPCWYVFWKKAHVVAGMDEFGYKHGSVGDYGVTYGVGSKFLQQEAANDSGGQMTLNLQSGATMLAGAPHFKHLRCVAITIMHENYHEEVFRKYGTDTSKQGDNDWLPDAEELTPSDRAYFPPSSPTNGDTFGIGPYGAGTYQDNEARARLIENNESLIVIDFAADWSADVENPKW